MATTAAVQRRARRMEARKTVAMQLETRQKNIELALEVIGRQLDVDLAKFEKKTDARLDEILAAVTRDMGALERRMLTRALRESIQAFELDGQSLLEREERLRGQGDALAGVVFRRGFFGRLQWLLFGR